MSRSPGLPTTTVARRGLGWASLDQMPDTGQPCRVPVESPCRNTPAGSCPARLRLGAFRVLFEVLIQGA
jgi:hypothetical protein